MSRARSRMLARYEHGLQDAPRRGRDSTNPDAWGRGMGIGMLMAERERQRSALAASGGRRAPRPNQPLAALVERPGQRRAQDRGQGAQIKSRPSAERAGRRIG